MTTPGPLLAEPDGERAEAVPEWDVIIVGGGPAGTSCATVCARHSLRVLVLERSHFPRDKVCGDCLNPAAWPVLKRLGLTERVRSLSQARLRVVQFIGCDERVFEVSLPCSAEGEAAIRRAHFDLLLLEHAREQGATVRTGMAAIRVKRLPGDARCLSWEVATGDAVFRSRMLVAADGRNSTVARLLGLLPPAKKDRVGLQTHIPLPSGVEGKVTLRFRPEGYCGLADIGNGHANLCLVAEPQRIDPLKRWACRFFRIPQEQAWRTITPLSRAPVPASHPGLLCVGDVARVVEPFTGEGIYYALASGELAGQAIVDGELAHYDRAHRELYRGRLWVNRVAKAACLFPSLATGFIGMAPLFPSLVNTLTHKVVRPLQP